MPSVISAAYAIKGYNHKTAGSTIYPTLHIIVLNLMERKQSPIITKKGLVSTQMIKDLCNIYANSQDLSIIRDLSMILIVFVVSFAIMNYKACVARRYLDKRVTFNFSTQNLQQINKGIARMLEQE